MTRHLLWLSLSSIAFLGAGGWLAMACGDDAPPPQPPAPTHQMVAIVAASTPPGATVTGGQHVLGQTPLNQNFPIPPSPPGQPPPQFEFTFALAGFQPQSVTAAPVNGVINLNVTLAPIEPERPAGPRTLEVSSQGGGPIRDFETTTARAMVDEPCTLASLFVRVQGSHRHPGDLTTQLTGPNNIRQQLSRKQGRASPFRRHEIREVAGIEGQGEYTLTVRDLWAQDLGTLNGFTLELNCQ